MVKSGCSPLVCSSTLTAFGVESLQVKIPMTHGCGSKNLVSGSRDQNLCNPSCLILSHTHMATPTALLSPRHFSHLPRGTATTRGGIYPRAALSTCLARSGVNIRRQKSSIGLGQQPVAACFLLLLYCGCVGVWVCASFRVSF